MPKSGNSTSARSALLITGGLGTRANERAPASEWPATACVARERTEQSPSRLLRIRWDRCSRRPRHPRASLAVGPLHPHLGLARIAETKVSPAELPPGVTATDGDLPSRQTVADAHLDPGADGVDVGRGLREAQADPVPHRYRR